MVRYFTSKIANREDSQFLKDGIRMKILRKAKQLYRVHSLDKHFKKELSDIESKSAISSRALSYAKEGTFSILWTIWA